MIKVSDSWRDLDLDGKLHLVLESEDKSQLISLAKRLQNGSKVKRLFGKYILNVTEDDVCFLIDSFLVNKE